MWSVLTPVDIDRERYKFAYGERFHNAGQYYSLQSRLTLIFERRNSLIPAPAEQTEHKRKTAVCDSGSLWNMNATDTAWGRGGGLITRRSGKRGGELAVP